MLLLQGTVAKVTLGGKDRVNKETGETEKTFPVAYVMHSDYDDQDAPLKLDSIKLKDNAQAEAFRKAVGQTVSVPVNLWHGDNTGGFWLAKGVLPVVLRELSKI